jgi:hypothetical protein
LFYSAYSGDRLHVVAHGVRRLEQLLGDVAGGGAAGDHAGDLLLPVGQLIGLDDQDARQLGQPRALPAGPLRPPRLGVEAQPGQ